MTLLNMLAYQGVQLDTVNFESLDRAKEPTSVSYKDEFDYDVYTNAVLVSFTRTVYFTPASFFEATITYVSAWEFDEGNTDKVLSLLEKITPEERDELVSTSCMEASLMIAQLTKSQSDLPLITPPEYITEQ